MADSTSISGPVDIKTDSAERVALELAYRIADGENDAAKNRAYWLQLYFECRRVVLNGRLA